MNSQEFKEILEQKRVQIDGALETLLPHEDVPPPLIHQAMRYSVLAGGKRFRPILCLASCEAFGGCLEDALPFACALELIHTYSLIHDDLPCMDDDDFRRGRATNHKVFGEAMAVLAGDALLTLAFEWMANARNVSSDIKMKIVQEVACASGSQGLVGGQVADLSCEGKAIDREKLQYIHAHKTGRLIEAAVITGAYLAKADSKGLAAIAEYGRNLGLAFQVTDDLLDVLGNEDQMGKAVNKDAQHEKATYPGIFGVEASKKIAEKCVQEAVRAIDFLRSRGDLLIAITHWIRDRQN